MRKRIKILALPALVVFILVGFYFYNAESSDKGPIQPIRFSTKFTQLKIKFHANIAIAL